MLGFLRRPGGSGWRESVHRRDSFLQDEANQFGLFVDAKDLHRLGAVSLDGAPADAEQTADLAAGHPFGATGARVVLTLANEMKRRGARYGLASVCAAGGNGAAIVLERAA